MAKGKAERLKARRHKGESTQGKLRGPNTGAWEKILQGLRRPAQSEGWSRGYDGPGKGTW